MDVNREGELRKELKGRRVGRKELLGERREDNREGKNEDDG